MSAADTRQSDDPSPAAGRKPRKPRAPAVEPLEQVAPAATLADTLHAENIALRQRIGLLEEELVAQIDYGTTLALRLPGRQAAASRPSRRTGALMSCARDALLAARSLRNQGVKGAMRAFLAAWRIRTLGDFDATFYASQRADLAGSILDPVQHYICFGAGEGLDPCPDFSTDAYQERNPDVAALSANPYAHYVSAGRAEGRRATPSRRLRRRAIEGGIHRFGRLRADPSAALSIGMDTWPLAALGDANAELGRYEIRPDDEVIREGLKGTTFLRRHQLRGESSAFAAAVAEINAAGPADDRPPVVSVIIPVYGALGYTLNCLDALVAHASRRPFEIIVVDDASTDETPLWLPTLKRIVYRRQAANGGFIAACHAGADAARGEILVFLNNDTRVAAGWLDELCNGLERLPDAGLVGSKLFYPDGELQEAGGIVWRDGSAWNYGRNDDPNRPQYCYARQVDYISGASIALRAQTWNDLGGFDPYYAPAYCEDSDLAFRVRQAGAKVWLQPTSRVIHYEGKTSGTDLTQGAKAYQVSNQVKFFERWREVLTAHRQNGDTPERERERDVQRRVLVLDATTPTPDQDAGSVTTVKVIEVFQALGYKVSFAPVDNFLFDPVYTTALMRMGVECLYSPYVESIESHLSKVGKQYDAVHVFRFPVLQETVETIRKYCPDAELVFNNMDLHYLRVERQAKVERSAALAAQARQLKAVELATMATADVICVPSAVEAKLLGDENVRPPVLVMPFMVDLHPPMAAHEARADVVFLGGFGHMPNVDAAVWMAKTIWPKLRGRLRGARLILAGANPTPEVLDLAGPDILVPGRIDDLGPLFEQTRVFVAPLRYGAGVKGKIYSAMAHGVPVVSTTIGAEGMDLEPGLEVLLGDEPDAFCRHVVDLYEDADLWSRLSVAGPDFVRRTSTVEAGVTAMRRVLEAAKTTRRQR